MSLLVAEIIVKVWNSLVLLGGIVRLKRGWACVLEEKYYGNWNFSKFELGSQYSIIWGSILAAKGLLLKGSSWQIGDGKSMLVWDAA
ncbi:hypothetical protein EPI10_023293 [Gossypium australe]|uniref:Uncharacterized protein n=1 Tax=Gossypium australe TaxID=47621 RepID=A0A5B6VTQ8_9ROSI|nr:hypothetical protein EPI10_023293 [Gossypium australe]